MGNLFIYLIASQVQLLHLSELTSSSPALTFVLILFLIFSIPLILSFDIAKSPVLHYFSIHKRYIGSYVAHTCINCALILLGNLYSSVVLVAGSYNSVVLILILIGKPYRELIDMIGIAFSQTTIVLWLFILIYKSYL